MFIISLFKPLIDWVRNYIRYHNTITELSRLSSRDLKDLGINKADFDRIARDSVNIRAERYV
jgi:hypothetical protein